MDKIKISKFEEFLLEKYLDSDAKISQRFYMLVKKPFPTDSENELGRMIGETRKMLFDQVSLNDSNYDTLVIKQGIPVLNFIEDNELVSKLVSEKRIDKQDLYNDPKDSALVSDKKVFHETFKEKSFVPKTVFSVKDALKLKFPVIAKPAQGKSAEGIKKFETPEELESSNEKFDVFSEMIDIEKEFRCFCFRDQIVELNQRLKIEGSKDFLKDTKTTTDFYYKKVNPEQYELREEMSRLLKECRSLVDLDFFSVDFAETPNGKLYLIEMNSRTGMGVDKMVELYKLIHKDYYNTLPDKESSRIMDKMIREWDAAYAKNKGSKVNECTTVAGVVGGTTFLFKNRDRSFTPDNTIIHENLHGSEVVYYTDQTGWIEGMNEHGMGFVFSMLTEKHYKGYGPSYYVTDDPKDDGKFMRFHKGLKKVLASKTVEEALSNLKDSEKSGSFLIGNKDEIFEVEVFKGETRKRKLSFEKDAYYVKTNHGILFPEAGHQEDGHSIKRASSTIRMHQALVQLTGIRDISEVPERMKFQAFDPESSLNTFRTDPEEYTISQCMMDLNSKTFYFFHDPLTADKLKVEDHVKKEHKIKIIVRTI